MDVTRRRPPGWDVVKQAVQAGFAALWGVGFTLLAATRQSRAAVQATAGAGRILVLAPHPDDEVMGCGGTMLRHRAAGAEVVVAYVTDGRRSRAFGLDPETMARTRRGEAEAAAAILGVDRVEWLGLPEGTWSLEDLAVPLRRLLARSAPTLVYAPSRVDFHPEHHRVAQALADVLSPPSDADGDSTTGDPTIRVYQVQVPLGAALVNRVVDITSVEAACHEALMAYVSQRGSILRSLRLKRYAGKAHRLPGLAEEFWELPAVVYTALHQGPADQWSERYRACRYLSVTDPASYLIGRTGRRQLRAAAQRFANRVS